MMTNFKSRFDSLVERSLSCKKIRRQIVCPESHQLSQIKRRDARWKSQLYIYRPYFELAQMKARLEPHLPQNLSTSVLNAEPHSQQNLATEEV